MRYPSRYAPIGRIGVRPDDPKAILGPRPSGSRRPHTDAAVAAVRNLVEGSVLTYQQIAAKTGVAPASICRWTRDGAWKRHLFAPRATDTVPTARASARLKARTLHARLAALAERHIRQLEESADIDPRKLGEALELLKLARLAAKPKRRRKPEDKAAFDALQTWEADTRTVLRSIRAAGIESYYAPEEALEDFVDSRKPPPEKRRRGRGSRFRGSSEYYAWLREKIEPER